ncbi:MAG: phosphoribosylformylglycinamidine synthase subunit PurL [Bacteroidia bacterium]|nr:phosphoribosylformylglycinamidine synthase subunit PurL [Bacteroidia bacterium]MDW8159058.1 phosphoribosylformylglycinamidine synthase subunit PurL [Bacteroidia bacterium]
MQLEQLTQEELKEKGRLMGLLEGEWDLIVQQLGRIPNFTELSVFSALWSEHCAYKHSIAWLKTLPKQGERVLAAAGEENAGLLNIGNGYAVCFKIESHNHPSAIEPYQGAATGVGGIHRDIIAMGARPIAALNSLRFGNINSPRTRYLLRGVVRGIGDYGNSLGIPTVGGEIYFDSCYHDNPLVNAMSVGIVKIGKNVSSVACGPGNPVWLVGSATGRDGIHGASFASQDIHAESYKSLPAVQIGDPFAEKLLLEAIQEAIETGGIVAMQDLGAAGIACASAEMSARGNLGMDLWLDKVHLRQPNMLPFEILLSESQERMMLIISPQKVSELSAIFEKWDLAFVQIGVVTDNQKVRYYWKNELIGQIPAKALVVGGGAPVYTPPRKKPKYLHNIASYSISAIPEECNWTAITRFLLQHPNICSRRWVQEQYDSMVGTATVSANIPAAAAVVWVKNTNMALSLSVDCNSRYVWANPRKGCALAVAEAARNVACTGAKPIGVTNCLNFGNPTHPEVYWQFVEAVEGLKEACEKFELPVTGGNVSFYNQSQEKGPIFPTPTIGMVGLIEDFENEFVPLGFRDKGDKIYLLGQVVEDIASSVYLYAWHEVEYSPAPFLDLDAEKRLQQLLLDLAKEKILHSAIDVSEGGVLIAILESAMAGKKGAFLEAHNHPIRADAFWLGEAGGRVVISVAPDRASLLEQKAKSWNIEYTFLGTVTTQDTISIGNQHVITLAEAIALYDSALENYLKT